MKIKDKICELCKVSFTPKKNKQRFCTLTCAAISLRGFDFKKADLIKFYINQEKSSLEIAELYGCSKPAILYQLRKHNIKRRTCGFSNYRQTDDFKEKQRLGTLQKWNDNVYRSKQIKSRKGKHYSPNTEFKKGSHPSPNTEFKKGHKEAPHIKAKRIKNSTMALRQRPTSPEQNVIEIIEQYNLPFRYTGDGRFWIKNVNPDFIHLHDKTVLEVYGDYWHNRPDMIQKDKERLETLISMGWNRLIVWEHQSYDHKTVLDIIEGGECPRQR